jgi:hypothetical protein
MFRPSRTARLLRRHGIRRKDGSPWITFEGGDGGSMEDAVVIRGAETDMIGTAAIFDWLTAVYGPGWELIRQSHGNFVGRHIDTVEIEVRTGAQRTVYFDITDHFGKFAPESAPPPEARPDAP